MGSVKTQLHSDGNKDFLFCLSFVWRQSELRFSVRGFGHALFYLKKNYKGDNETMQGELEQYISAHSELMHKWKTKHKTTGYKAFVSDGIHHGEKKSGRKCR